MNIIIDRQILAIVIGILIGYNVAEQRRKYLEAKTIQHPSTRGQNTKAAQTL